MCEEALVQDIMDKCSGVEEMTYLDQQTDKPVEDSGCGQRPVR